MKPTDGRPRRNESVWIIRDRLEEMHRADLKCDAEAAGVTKRPNERKPSD